ncbi:unnamed protein product [Nippostrongylus brasiliensis]|uniref:Helicase ATP-binding domain-containing protein n=1 Tax=Nippostrongylus brasiliensis TaxID=27835 RepID=A0A158R121_NIPBR|nr:unnamed protein product [Nippostrongylus brasiliensis]
MSTEASLKFTTNLNSCASSDTDGTQFIIDEKIDEEDCKSRSTDGGPPGSRQNVAENSSRKRSGLLSVKIPTGTKAQKRRHIQTNFDDSLLLNQSAIDAQRKEKERLERLERQKQLVGDSDHIQQVASVTQKPVTPLPVLDAFDPEIICLIGDGSSDDSKKRVPVYNNSSSASGVKPEPEVIELSSGDEDDSSDTKGSSSFAPYRIVPPIPRSYEHDRRPKWLYADKDRQEKMEMQQKIEKERMRKRRNSHDLEKIELTQTGRLLVNAGHGADEPDVHVSAYLTHILQPHQLGGVRFMYDNIIESLSEFDKSPGFGCILAHSMGLGKTIQVITFVEVFLRVTPAKRVTVIVPINTIQNWYNEFEKWLPRYSDVGQSCRQFEVFLLGDTVKTYDQRINMIEEWTKKGGVLLIGYEMFRLLIRSTLPKKSSKSKASASNASLVDQYEKVDEQEFTAEGRVKKEANDIIRAALISPGPDLVVCDEGHKIKNLNTDIASALGAIKTRRRIVLTGYPLQNNLMEYYCMVDFVRPDFLGSKKTFSIQFEKPIKNGQCIDSTAKLSHFVEDIKIARQRIHVLNNMLKGFIQRQVSKLAMEVTLSLLNHHQQTRHRIGLLRISIPQPALPWAMAEIAMGSYKVGHIEHGYKIVLALDLLDACIKKGEKMLIFRYGQQRRTYIYRLILNNCMEKAIFNRQISKHGLQQRVVDDAQVDANITQKELETLLMYDEPFLHESLMLEREEGLSEEEKKEAELWFTREQFKETILFPNDVDINDFPGRHGQGHPRGHRQVSGGFMPPQYFNAEGGYQMAPGFNGGLVMRNQVNHPMDQPRRVLPFPGAAVAYEPSSNSSGCVQLIRTDRASSGLPPVITIPPDPPQPQPMPHLLKNNIPDVIELD